MLFRSTRSTTSYGISIKHSYSQANLAECLYELVGHGARNKHLPAFWAASPREFREGLFAGLMDTDGSISISNAKKKPQLMANYSSVSLRLIQEVQLLAASIGIVSRITATKTPAGLSAWTLGLSSVDIKRWGGKHLRHPDKLKKLASTSVLESPSYVRQDIVPAPKKLMVAILKSLPTPKDRNKWPEGQAAIYNTISSGGRNGYIPRNSAARAIEYIGEDSAILMEWDAWISMVQADDVTWDMVVDVEITGQVEPGYDLTVPGTETFMSASGIILSNTMSYHVPISDDAVRNAREKMLPSKNLKNAKDFDVHYVPTQEYLYGLFRATRKKSDRRVKEYATKADAIKAYQRGELDANDEVVIRG